MCVATFCFAAAAVVAAATTQARDGLTQRQAVLAAMRERPVDPWPRGEGHVVLAIPGSSERDKAYHEPGGSLSPAVGSFGISLWIADPTGAPTVTSDTIPLDHIKQRFDRSTASVTPDIVTETESYTARWSCEGVRRLRLELQTRVGSTFLVIRSVGPAGGPVRSLHWYGGHLLVNDRWTISVDPPPDSVHVGHEGQDSWMTQRAHANQWTGDDGWGWARMELKRAATHVVRVVDKEAADAAADRRRRSAALQEGFELDVPEPEFAACLEAQVAHLMMGTVGDETRPGEPTNYPLNWLRDGAYFIAALARAGRLETARRLCGPFARDDFVGGFGPEADGPGLALWALSEVSDRAHSPAYDRSLWPHVKRKVGLIVDMLSARAPIHKPVIGPIVPSLRNDPEVDLVCDASRNGLIVGRMDHHRPLLFVNAVSYCGLLCAARIADRTGHALEGRAWRERAAELRRAWQAAFRTPEAGNERTYICGLWPTWVVDDAPAYARALDARWVAMHDARDDLRETPLWTYFNVAEVHQWLYAGNFDRAWETLRWFLAHQASPGLYTWWEGSGEENTFGGWQEVRGWVRPQHVTPHYWTAAEMLLLQIDMLAYVDDSAPQPILVVGAGVRPEWLTHTMRVAGLRTRLGTLGWKWQPDGGLDVRVGGSRCRVVTGPAFPTDTKIRVEFSKGAGT